MRGLPLVVATGLVTLLAAASAVAPPETRAGDGPSPPRVTLIGDSVATALGQFDAARRILGAGVDLRLEVAPCRRVGQESCPYQGERTPNVIQLAERRGPALGPTVIVSAGYNDDEELYAANIEAALDALRRAGVERVLWATLRAVRHPYLTMNDAIEAAAARHAELTVVDWNVYSRSHPDWFQPDGLHLGYDGAVAMARLFRSALAKLGVPQRSPASSRLRPLRIVTPSLPRAVSRRPYTARLEARGGRPPYRWSPGARFPSWLRLTARGQLTSTVPAAPGRLIVAVRVRDAAGASAGRRLTWRVVAQPRSK